MTQPHARCSLFAGTHWSKPGSALAKHLQTSNASALEYFHPSGDHSREQRIPFDTVLVEVVGAVAESCRQAGATAGVTCPLEALRPEVTLHVVRRSRLADSIGLAVGLASDFVRGLPVAGLRSGKVGLVRGGMAADKTVPGLDTLVPGAAAGGTVAAAEGLVDLEGRLVTGRHRAVGHWECSEEETLGHRSRCCTPSASPAAAFRTADP